MCCRICLIIHICEMPSVFDPTDANDVNSMNSRQQAAGDLEQNR